MVDDNERTYYLIREQIDRMRKAYVEPYTVTMSPAVYSKMGKPRVFYGIPVDCDQTLKCGWLVR